MSYIHDIKMATNGKYWNLPEIQISGLVLHSVGTPQPSADVFERGFNSQNIHASVHGWIEPGRFLQTAPCMETLRKAKKCYHCGSSYKGSFNDNRIGIEMTEPNTISYSSGRLIDLNPSETANFLRQVIATAVEVFADICRFHRLGASSIRGHQESHQLGYASNHSDPDHVFALIGYSMEQFRTEVQAKLDEGKDVLSDMTLEQFNEALDVKIQPLITEIAALQNTVKELQPVIYKTMADVPEWYAPTIQKLVDSKQLVGTGNDELNITEDMARILTIMDRPATVATATKVVKKVE